MTPKWHGPSLIVTVQGPPVFEVEYVVTGKRECAHAARLLAYPGCRLNTELSEEEMEIAERSEMCFETISETMDIRKEVDRLFSLWNGISFPNNTSGHVTPRRSSTKMSHSKRISLRISNLRRASLTVDIVWKINRNRVGDVAQADIVGRQDRKHDPYWRYCSRQQRHITNQSITTYRIPIFTSDDANKRAKKFSGTTRSFCRDTLK